MNIIHKFSYFKDKLKNLFDIFNLYKKNYNAMFFFYEM